MLVLKTGGAGWGSFIYFSSQKYLLTLPLEFSFMWLRLSDYRGEEAGDTHSRPTSPSGTVRAGHTPSMWSVHAQSRYQCMISHVISSWSVTWLVYDHPHDQCMGSHVISAWLDVISAFSVSWSVHDSHVISAWSVTWWVYYHSRDRFMVDIWSVYDQPCDKCMIATWSVHYQ